MINGLASQLLIIASQESSRWVIPRHFVFICSEPLQKGLPLQCPLPVGRFARPLGLVAPHCSRVLRRLRRWPWKTSAASHQRAVDGTATKEGSKTSLVAFQAVRLPSHQSLEFLLHWPRMFEFHSLQVRNQYYNIKLQALSKGKVEL